MQSLLPSKIGSLFSFINLLIFLLICKAVTAQDLGIIYGVVKTSDGKPAEAVNISLQGTTKKTVVDADGNYTLINVVPGNYTISASFIGLATQTKTITLHAGARLHLDFELTESGQQLQEVMVSGGANKFSRKESAYVSRLPLKNLENPQVYTTVGKELIQEQVTTDVGEAMRNIPGALAIKAGGGSSGIMSRGFATYANLRNGMNTSAIGPEDPVNLERIESIKGPSGTLFGNTQTSFGGLVNYVTKKPFETFKGEVSYTTGSWELSRVTADINTPLNGQKSLLLRTTTALQTQNSFQDQGYAKSYTFAPKLTYKVNDRLVLNLETELVGQDWASNMSGNVTIGPRVTATNFRDLPLAYKRALAGNGISNQNGIVSVFATADYQLSDHWKSQTNYAFSEGHYDHYNYITYNWISTDSVGRQFGYWEPNKFGQMQFQQNFIGDFNIGEFRNRLVVGVDYTRYYYYLNRSNTAVYDTVQVTGSIPDISKSGLANWAGNLNYTYSSYVRNVYSAYASDVLNLRNNLMVMLSLRVDRNETDGSYNSTTGLYTGGYGQTALSPKLGLVYQPIKDKISIFGNYMNGFQNLAPAVQGPDGILGSLKPQQANQLEGGLKIDLFDGKINGTFSYYDIRITNATYTDPNNAAYTIQDGTQRSRGFEAEVIANPVPGLNIVAGYGHNENKYTKSSLSLEGKFATAAPQDIANLWVSYRITQGKATGLGVGFGGNYVGDSWFNATNTFTLPGYTLLNATVFLDRPKYNINVKMNNLSNEKFWNSFGNPQNLRNVAISLGYKF